MVNYTRNKIIINSNDSKTINMSGPINFITLNVYCFNDIKNK